MDQQTGLVFGATTYMLQCAKSLIKLFSLIFNINYAYTLITLKQVK